MSSRRFAVCGLASAVAIFFVASSIVLIGSPLRPGLVAVAGMPAAAFTLPDADLHMLSLNTLRGKVVLLCIADPRYCGSEQYSRLAALQRSYRSEPRVAPVTVIRTEIEPGTVRARELCQNLATAGIGGARVIDVQADVWRDYRVDQSATLFVIDAEGTIRLRTNFAGDRTAELARARTVIDNLLPDSVAVARGR